MQEHLINQAVQPTLGSLQARLAGTAKGSTAVSDADLDEMQAFSFLMTDTQKAELQAMRASRFVLTCSKQDNDMRGKQEQVSKLCLIDIHTGITDDVFRMSWQNKK